MTGSDVSEFQGGIVRLSADAPLVRLTIENPPMNAMTPEVLVGLWEAALQAGSYRTMRVLLIRGGKEGRFFCPGADLDRLQGRKTVDSQVNLSTDPRPFDLPAMLGELSAVTVAGLNGSAAGAGFGLAMACDLRFASSAARLNSAFLDVGVAGDLGLAWSLTNKLGPARAADIMYRPRKITAEQAQAIGLVSEVFDDAVFDDELETAVQALAAAKPAAIRGMKDNLGKATALSRRAYLRHETGRHMIMTSPEVLADPNYEGDVL
ncbi:enoyl-CoA hydratase/isomerase family protein [Cumulibacter soli]|uniref:enoyl-CoA hydratase/isomerase family protein n=1 Tax=Cumulibacter soli TaxID=2546344 RepID=UPI0010674F3C|nr:enoyl-CoA hydratase/isomerase family protein [Cumulibacter soli]